MDHPVPPSSAIPLTNERIALSVVVTSGERSASLRVDRADVHYNIGEGALTIELEKRLPLTNEDSFLFDLFACHPVTSFTFMYIGAESSFVYRQDYLDMHGAEMAYERLMPPQPADPTAYVERASFRVNSKPGQ